MMELIPVAVLQKRITQASKKGSTYLRRSSESFAEPRDLGFAEASEEVCSISFNSSSPCAGLRDRSRALRAASFFPRLKSQRGDSDTNTLPTTNRRPAGIDIQKMPRHALSFTRKIAACEPVRMISATR